jgi:dienelactone hydrolase
LRGIERGPENAYGAKMATVLLFHHAQGQTPGFLSFADDLRRAGHTVHAPDLYDGRRFGDLREGVAYAEQVGFPEIIRLGSDAAKGLPADIVYAGFSLGVLPAQALAQTRAGARGALLFHSCVSPSEFGTSWPEAVPLQIHMTAADEWAMEDKAVAEALVEKNPSAELFVYPGSAHLFADPSAGDYDERADALLKERTLAFLHRVG